MNSRRGRHVVETSTPERRTGGAPPAGKSYLLALDYGSRSQELPLVSEIWHRFDRETLATLALVVSNNPYCFEFYLYLSFARGEHDFETWLSERHPDRARRYTLFIDDVFAALVTRGYNLLVLREIEDAERVLTPEADGTVFLFPEREVMDEEFHITAARPSFTVFLSHAGSDRVVVDRVLDELQRAEIHAWYDKYEIQPGDSVSDRISDGLSGADLGILFVSSAFLDPRSGWQRGELNYFFQHRMRTGKRIVCVDVDLAHDALPPLVQDIRYIRWQDKGALRSIVDAVTRASRRDG